MKCLTILNGELNIPLAIVSGISYTKTGNLIETHKNTFYCKGYGCQNIAVSFSLTPNVLPLFYENNAAMAPDSEGKNAWTFTDLVKYFINVKPNRLELPFHVYLADHCLCPELMFSITSCTQSLQSDLNGNVLQCDISMTLSGTACSKESSRAPEVSYDVTSELPVVTLTVNDKSVTFADDIHITEFQLTPTTAHLQVLLSTSFKTKSTNAWVYMPAQSENSFVEIKGFGKFYIQNAEWDGDLLSLECSKFSKQSEELITKTFIDASLNDVINTLNIPIEISSKATALKAFTLSHLFIRENSINALRILRDNLGFIVAATEDKFICYDLPTEFPANLSPIVLDAFINTDTVSAKTTRVVIRDGLHEYSHGTEEGQEILINSPICSTVDRSSQLLRLNRFLENTVEVTIPYDSRIKHHSIVQCENITGIVTDYNIDFLQNIMTLGINYLQR